MHQLIRFNILSFHPGHNIGRTLKPALSITCARPDGRPGARPERHRLPGARSPHPCVEGDNDSRDGAVLEMECEQYVTGFTDLYLNAKLNERDNVCLPETGNRADEILGPVTRKSTTRDGAESMTPLRERLRMRLNSAIHASRNSADHLV